MHWMIWMCIPSLHEFELTLKWNGLWNKSQTQSSGVKALFGNPIADTDDWAELNIEDDFECNRGMYEFCDTWPDAGENASNFMVQKVTNNWNGSIGELSLRVPKIAPSKLWMASPLNAQCTQRNLLKHFIWLCSPRFACEPCVDAYYLLCAGVARARIGPCICIYIIAVSPQPLSGADFKINKNKIFYFWIQCKPQAPTRPIKKEMRNCGTIYLLFIWTALAAMVHTHKSNWK